MASKYLFPALALAGSVVAQCGTGGSVTLANQADATALQNCVTYNGNIIIDSSATGSIALNGIRQISGDLSATNASTLVTISSDQLQSITGRFNLQDLQTLSTLEMDSLTSVGSLVFIGLPNLQNLQFTRGITTATDVYISNTDLRDLSGIELMQVGRMDINNNNQLNTVNVNNMANVTEYLSFSANGRNLNIMLPNLLDAANLTFRTASSVELPSLFQVQGAVGFYGNSFLNVSAPNLTRIAETLAIVGCASLDNISFPQLELVRGGLIVANNSNLKSIEGFPSLARIGGAIDLYGTFDAADLPALSTVRGAATIVTSSTNNSICDSFRAYESRDVINGQVNCYPGTSSNLTNGTGSGSSGTTGHNAASSFAAGSSMAVTAVVALVAGLLLL